MAKSLGPPSNQSIPILVGGFSELALRRAAKHNGWISDMHSFTELKALIEKLNQYRIEANNLGKDYEIIAFSCWDAFHKEGFLDMFSIGVTTITTYPWFLYGMDNSAPLRDKISSLENFRKEFIE